ASLPVPRARLLADVASEDPVLERRAQLDRDRAPVLDRQVREAAARIHRVAGTKRAGRTGGVAARAAAAVGGGRGHGVEREVGEELGEEEVGSRLAVEDERVLADPPEPGPHRPFALEDRPGVDVVPEARAREHGAEAD